MIFPNFEDAYVSYTYYIQFVLVDFKFWLFGNDLAFEYLSNCIE